MPPTPAVPAKPPKTANRAQRTMRTKRREATRPGNRAQAPGPVNRADAAKPGKQVKRVAAADQGRNSVRIIAGGWRGRRVHFPDVPGLRPTPDRVRETLFNWLQPAIPGARCLDLFAGSGALGLEALSRGAKSVVFVEQAQAAARSLVRELARLGGSSRALVVEMGAARFLRAAGGAATNPRDASAAPFAAPFDVAFLDPPFGRDALHEFIALIDAGDWLKTGALVYLENEKSAGIPGIPPHWQLLKSKSAGEVGYHLVRVNARTGP